MDRMAVPSWCLPSAWLVWRPDPRFLFQPKRVVIDADDNYHVMPTAPGQPEIVKYPLKECRSATIEDVFGTEFLVFEGGRIDLKLKGDIIVFSSGDVCRRRRLKWPSEDLDAQHVCQVAKDFAHFFGGVVVNLSEEEESC